MAKHRHESDRESKEFRDLRKRFQKVISENLRLRKDINRLEQALLGQAPTREFKPKIEPVVEPAEKFGVESHQCHKCGAYTKNVFQLLDNLYFKCEGCGSKGKIP